jgi:hypothetical protein
MQVGGSARLWKDLSMAGGVRGAIINILYLYVTSCYLALCLVRYTNINTSIPVNTSIIIKNINSKKHLSSE